MFYATLPGDPAYELESSDAAKSGTAFSLKLSSMPAGEGTGGYRGSDAAAANPTRDPFVDREGLPGKQRFRMPLRKRIFATSRTRRFAWSRGLRASRGCTDSGIVGIYSGVALACSDGGTCTAARSTSAGRSASLEGRVGCVPSGA